ncbi:tight junction protein ZO-1-like isoform X11 [Carassius carassius]|uniref:tight junction protein ZO-1-like isoform X11 n=1 Tax=Carassius carassius TaxID=217509 RepID=UPI002868F0AC|nr:tight junction protein ZO-1-like isoform X11 [Carassius carassius]
MKYQKYITVMQMAMGVTASNKDDCIPPKRQLWVPPDSDAIAASAVTPPAAAASQGKPSLRRIKGRIHRSKSLDSIDLLDCNSTTMEETVIWEQHTVTLLRAPGFGFGIAISGGRDNPHFQSGETSIVISDVLKGGPAEGLLQENDRVAMVNGVSMDNVEHAYAVQQLRKSGKNAKITIRRKRKVQIPVSRGGDRETMSEREEEDDTEEDDYEGPARAGEASGSTSRRNERSGSAGRRDHSNSRERSISPRSDRRSVASSVPARPSKVTLVKSRKNEEYGLRLASHIFVKDISSESLAARDGNIQEGDVVLKINGTVTENLSLIDAKKLIERSKGKLKMVVQRDERATLLNIPDLDNSIPSANSERDDISEIHSLASDHSHERSRRSRSHSPDKRSEPSDISSHSPQQISNGRLMGSFLTRMLPLHRSREEERISKPTAVSTPVKIAEDARLVQPTEQAGDKQIPPLPEPKPVYAQPGQPDVDLPVSPSDAPVPSVTHDDSILRPSMKLVKFKKGESVGLRLAGGNDVGIFVAGVLEDSPAAKEGLEEGDQILRVNNVDFANIIREEAVLFLLDLPRGEEVTILAQRKKDVYRRIVESDVGDSFYIRTHFEYEKESPYGLSFNKGEVFRVVDTLYNGKLGSWLAIRIGKNHQEVERGIIPNKNRAEQLSSVQYTLPKTAGGDRADFWRFRGLRSSKRNLRKSREDLSAQPVQTKFPAYERVVLREAGFLRPVVIFGPIADVARDKLAREVPDLFELASKCPFVSKDTSEPKDAGTDQRSSGIIRLHTIKQIIDRDKHAVLDITPNAVDRLNYAQWYPIVVFLNPDSKQGVKNMRTRLCPESRKSARKLHERALKLRKNNHHLFTATINMNNMNDGWYGALKETILQQQNQLVWVSEGKADGAPGDDLDLHDDRLSFISAPGSEYSMYSTDSRHTSDYEDTDTEGGAYTDQELDETLNDEVGPPTEPAITRSSEPVREDPPVIQEPPGYRVYQPEPLNRIDPAGFKAPAPQQQMYKKDIYRKNELVQVSQNPMQPNYNPQQPRYQEDKPYRDYDHQPYRYDGGYMEPKPQNFDPHQHYDSSVPPYDDQWAPYDQTSGYDHHMPYEDGLNGMYGHPQMQHDTGYDASRPRYGKPSPGPIRHDELPPVHPQYDQEALPRTQASSRSPEPPKQQYQDPSQRPSYTQPQQRGYKNAEASLTPPKPESMSPPVEPALPPPPPADAEDDPALKPRSVLTRVKMFENKRSVSVDRAGESADSGIRPVDMVPKPGAASVPKASSLSNLDQEKASRSPEAQQPQPKAADIIRSNNNDPDEDEEYYRKQLSFFDRRSFDSKPSAQLPPVIKPAQPLTQPGYYPRAESAEKINPVAPATPAVPPPTLPKPTVTPPLDSHGSPKVKHPNHEDSVQSTSLPPKRFPEKSPVNGTGEPPKTNSTATYNYNRFVPKPYTTSARPFQQKFDSPKFNHNLLPNDSQNKTDNVKAPVITKPQSSPQPTDHDSGLDTFTRTMDQKPKYLQNNINAVPKAIPVSPSALEEDDDDDDSHTVVATARGIFNSNGGVLSSIETGVSIIIPQGAIPDGVEQEIYFKVCRDNSILPPLDKEKGETLLSPLVMCGPHGLKFLKPVELRLPHCASMTPDGWSFALKSSDSSSGDPKSWQNKSVPGDPNYLVGANCVSVLIDHF